MLPLGGITGESAINAASARQFQLLCRSSNNLFHNRDSHRKPIRQSHGNARDGCQWRSFWKSPGRGLMNHPAQLLAAPTALCAPRHTRAASTTTSRRLNVAAVPVRPTPSSKVTKSNTASSFEPPTRPPQPYLVPPVRDTDEFSTVPPILRLQDSKYKRPKPLYDELDLQPTSSSALWQGHSPEEEWQPKEGTFLYELANDAENFAKARAGRPMDASTPGDYPYMKSEAAETMRLWDRFKRATTGDGRFISGLVYMVIVYWVMEQIRQAPESVESKERAEKRRKRKRGELESPEVKGPDEASDANASVPVVEATASTAEIGQAEASATPLEALAQVLEPSASTEASTVSTAAEAENGAVQQISEKETQGGLANTDQTFEQAREDVRDETGQASEKGDKPTSSWMRWLKIW